jgi:hypothetical protein
MARMFSADHCLICASKDGVRLFDEDTHASLVSVDCSKCGGFRILMTLEPSAFDQQRGELQTWIKKQPSRPVILHNWKEVLANANPLKPNF